MSGLLGLSGSNGRWRGVRASLVALLVSGSTVALAQLAPSARPASAAAPASSALSVRDQEIASCRPGELQTWGDGQDRPVRGRRLLFAYRHDGAPVWFSEAQVVALLRGAVQGWSPCGVAARVVTVARDQAAPADAIQILWSETGSRGQAGMANLAAGSLSLSPGVFRLLKERRPDYPGEQTLQMTLSHEMGHFYGLSAHSRRCVDVMSYYDDGRGNQCALRDPSIRRSFIEYRSPLPTACDIARCQAVNR